MSEAEQRGEGLSVNLFMLDIYYLSKIVHLLISRPHQNGRDVRLDGSPDPRVLHHGHLRGHPEDLPHVPRPARLQQRRGGGEQPGQEAGGGVGRGRDGHLTGAAPPGGPGGHRRGLHKAEVENEKAQAAYGEEKWEKSVLYNAQLQ